MMFKSSPARWLYPLLLCPIITSHAAAFDEPYCGLYSMHAALHSLNIPAAFEGMIDRQYLSGKLGSTADDLMRLAQKHGARSRLMGNMTIADLRAAKSPIILHTSIAVSKVGYHHWVCFLGMDGDAVRLYDPPGGMYTVSTADLLSYWDGIGIAVYSSNAEAPRTVADFDLLLAFLLVSSIAGSFALIPRHRLNPAPKIGLVALLAAACWHLCVPYGFWGNNYALAIVESRSENPDIPIIDLEQFRNLIDTKTVTIVDARRPLNYNRSHVPGAINLPITVTHGALRDVIEEIPAENHVIVYCQSEKCTWADSIASLFPAHGREQVSIYRGGMNGWNSDLTNAR